MPYVTPTARAGRRRRLSAVALMLFGTCCTAAVARAADLPFEAEGASALPPVAGGGGYWAPRVPVRPAPTRFDIYGYPLLGPGLVGRPAPHALGVGCPLALEPAYDPDGNLAGYAPLQYCR